MYITQEEYARLGYTAVPENTFSRYAVKAEAVVRKFTFDRISDEDLRPDETAKEPARRVAELNQRGVCEVMDVLYAQDQSVIGAAGAPIKSFTNEGYSETLDTAGWSAVEAHRKIRDIMCIYFSAEQLYRGVT